MPEHLIIAGGGQAATQAAQSARQAGFGGNISLLSEETSLPYQRPPLSKKFLAGEIDAERLLLKPAEFYRKRDIDLLLDTRVDAVDASAREVSLSDGRELAFSHLLLATGAEPRRLELPGTELGGVHYLRSIDDVTAIRREFAPGKRLVIVGAGYIGLEVAAVAIESGLSVTVLEADARVMSRAVCPEVSRFYADYHRQRGVDLRLRASLKAFHGDTSVREAELSQDERLACDLVVIGIGIRPRTRLAEQAGLRIDDGISVDACCRTEAPGVFAAGDCASIPHPWIGRRIRLESVHNAIEQGKAAGASIAGVDAAFDSIPWFWSDQYDLKLQIAGLSSGYDTTVVRGDIDGGSFSVFYLAGGRVIAVDAINDARMFIMAKQRLGEKPRWPVEAIADTDCDLSRMET
jgi:3-phenylpropionate/trans-cinnamate dioxygenase ferredoxin reductase subunit